MKLIYLCLFLPLFLFALDYKVKNSTELMAAVKKVNPGDRILLTADKYKGGIQLNGLMGTKEKAIIIEGKDGLQPVFKGGRQALHLVDCHYITLKNFKVSGFPTNGINIDDGAREDTPPVGIVLDNLTVTDIGPKGNFDAVKLSGLNGFTIKNCSFNGWGGSAIDMVGCHNGIIHNNIIKGEANTRRYSQSTGIQTKGGCFNIRILNNIFQYAGSRAINLGGSTGLPYFRPKGANFEAKDIEVAGNHFQHGQAFIAFATSKNGYVHHNTFIEPDKWVLRILQETDNPHFIKCQKGRFEYNIVVFDKRVRSFVNVGPNTDVNSFIFKANAWFDKDGNRKPNLPVIETDGIYGINPNFRNVFVRTNPKLVKYGAEAYEDGKW